MDGFGTFDELFHAASMLDPSLPDRTPDPYHYQRRLAEEGLPELLLAPTGCGKTAAAVLAWLWRRRFHPDLTVRADTPRRLVYVLPQRVLVEQVAANIHDWLRALGLEHTLHSSILMGGEGRSSGAWRLRPEDDAILVATQDMALSAVLNRRYGESRWIWPIDFGLLNNDCAYVFDEIQLMGPGLPTSRQIEGLRHKLGTAVRCTSTWMSATVDQAQLATVDRPEIASQATLGTEDRDGHLALRLGATRTVRQLPIGDAKSYAKDIAVAVLAQHRPGTRSIIVLNTVQRAVDVKQALEKAEDEDGPNIVLVHSRFRPGDRKRHLQAATAESLPAAGTIVVTTQVLEAGVDITSDIMFTETAVWSSVVQRAGRCNRDGLAPDAILLWATPPTSHPYTDTAVEDAAALLASLEGRSMTTEQMAGMAPPGDPVVHPVLRRRDLLELFDTLPDLSGSDIDVSRFIRDANDREVAVAWELLDGPPSPDLPIPAAEARCPVPIADAKYLIQRRCWRHDHLARRWVRCNNVRDLRPGMMVIVDAKDGGYDADLGWVRSARSPVVPVEAADEVAGVLATDTDVGDDPLSTSRASWLGLTQHLRDVEAEARAIDTAISPPGLTPHQRRAAIVAGGLHDLGKVHPVFQDTLSRSATTDSARTAASEHGPPWAKSASPAGPRHQRRYFRHELASALALLDEGSVALNGEEEPDLIIYLVAAHHGRVRLGFRSLPEESEPPSGFEGRAVALGIVDGEPLPSVEVPGMFLPASHLDLSVMKMGTGLGDRPSWGQRMLPLRDRDDLGPFRVGFLEALVRMADWRASAMPGEGTRELLP